MKTSSLILIVIAVVLVISLISIWFYPSIQDFMASNTMWNGINKYFDASGAVRIDSLDSLPAEPGQSVLISIPYVPFNTDNLERTKQFVNNGGTLLLMDDFGYGNDVLANLGIGAEFSHQLLLDPLFCYKSPDLPRITDFSPAVKDAGIGAIAFNHSTVLNKVDPGQALAWSSSYSFLDLNGNGVKDGGEPAGPFVVAAEYPVGSGIVAMVSDPSLIINTMTEQNDNYKFVQYLTGLKGAEGKIMLDSSHLTQAPLDVSKVRLANIRATLASPFVLLGIVAMIFILVGYFTLRKGEIFGQH